MIELRWVEFGPNKQLEYRTKIYSGRRLDATGPRDRGHAAGADARRHDP